MRPCYQYLEEVARRSHIVTVPFVFVRACPKTPKELAAGPARRNVCQVLQLAFCVFGPRAYEPPRRQRFLAWAGRDGGNRTGTAWLDLCAHFLGMPGENLIYGQPEPSTRPRGGKAARSPRDVLPGRARERRRVSCRRRSCVGPALRRRIADSFHALAWP